MNALEYYLSEVDDPSLLVNKEMLVLDQAFLDEKQISPEAGHAIAFQSQRSLFWGGARRVSPDGKWLEFSSLFGGFRISAESVDVNAPIELFLVSDDSLFQCSYAFSPEWQGYSPDGHVRMKAKKDSQGRRMPLINWRSIRGERTKRSECLIWLPEAPSKIEKKNDGALLCSRGEVYWVDHAASKAIEEGDAKWVLPGVSGWFELPHD